MISRVSTIILSSLIVVLTGCGGGGGGGGGGNSGTTGVRVLHGAIDAVPVELVADGSPEFDLVKFGKAGGYMELGGGQHLISLYPAKSRVAPLLNRSVTTDGSQKFTVLFFGDRGDLGLTSTLISEDSPVIQSGVGIVRGIHAVAGASILNFSIGGKNATANYGGVSPYVELPAGPHPFVVTRAADGAVVARGTVSVGEGTASSIFTGGSAGYYVTSEILAE